MNKKLDLDPSKLLGFKILNRPGSDTALIGTKIGKAPPSDQTKIGAKIGKGLT
jgi:hypothetical protein